MAFIVLLLASLAIYMNNSGVKFTLVELLLQITPAFLIGIHWKDLKAATVFTGMAAGLVFAISFFWVDDKSGTQMAMLKTSGLHPVIWALVLNGVIALGGALVIRGKHLAWQS